MYSRFTWIPYSALRVINNVRHYFEDDGDCDDYGLRNLGTIDASKNVDAVGAEGR